MVPVSRRPIAVVSPGLTAGGGLKQPWPGRRCARELVSPGLTAGGGLKLRGAELAAVMQRFPRPHRRGRIETSAASSSGAPKGTLLFTADVWRISEIIDSWSLGLFTWVMRYA